MHGLRNAFFANTKHMHNARKLIQKGVDVAGKKPMTLITDGPKAYRDAYLREYWASRKTTRIEYMRHTTIQGDRNNNKVERFNGEVRDREKVIRGLRKPDTPILTGYQIYHNYMRPHEALNGKTPAELCRIEVKGHNKWIRLIQNANQDE